MLALVKINMFLDYIFRLNEALDAVGLSGRFIPISLEQKYGVIVGRGLSALKISRFLYISGKIDCYYEIGQKTKQQKVYAVRFKDTP